MPELFAEIAEMAGSVTGTESPIPPDATLEGDLGLDSLDVADLGARLRDRYGVDLTAFLATLDIDELVALTIGDLARHVAGAVVSEPSGTAALLTGSLGASEVDT
jgi:acyl carrier protein